MTRRSLTIFVLRRSVPGFSRLRLPYGLLASGGGVLAGLLLITLAAPRLWLALQAQSEAARRLDAENQRLRAERSAIASSLSAVNDRLEAVESWAARIAGEMGLPALPSSAAPAGGAAFDEDWEAGGPGGEIEGLHSRLDRLDRSFQALDEAAEQRLAESAVTPSLMPVNGWLSHGFGWRDDPFTGEREFHRGLDIVAPTNTGVQAPADGVVVHAGRHGTYGKLIEIEHGQGFATRHAHLDSIGVGPGDRVRRGQIIGRVGSTGRSTGPHLHYEVLREGRVVNPAPYIDPAAR